MNTKTTTNNNLAKAKRVVLFRKFEEGIFSTETAIKVCHMPYRRFSDWDRKGVLPHHGRESIEGWRTFSFYDLLIIKIISLLRKHGIPMPKVKKVYHWLNAEEKNIHAVTQKVLKKNTYIATNLKDSHAILSGEDFGAAVRLAENSMFVFKLNSIFDELLEELNN